MRLSSSIAATKPPCSSCSVRIMAEGLVPQWNDSLSFTASTVICGAAACAAGEDGGAAKVRVWKAGRRVHGGVHGGMGWTQGRPKIVLAAETRQPAHTLERELRCNAKA